MKIALGIFIIAHGLVHSILAIAPNPADAEPKPGKFFTTADRSWLLPKMGISDEGILWIGLILVALSTLGFLLAGMGIIGISGISTVWRMIAVISAIVSLLLLISFWHPWLPVGVIINLLIIICLLWVGWPPPELIGS